MRAHDIRWNEQARAKIVDDADLVLQRAVLEVAAASPADSDAAYAQLNEKLRGRFIDYQPGPDIRIYADAIVNGEIDPDAEEPVDPADR